MSNFFLKPALLGLLLLGGGLGAQSVATEPQKRTWPVHVPVYMQPAQVDPAKVLGPPPVPGSLAAAADLEAVLMAQAFRTPEQEAWARYIDTDGVFKHAPEIGPWFNARELPKCEAFFNRILGDAHGVSERAKRLYARPRPPRVDATIRPCVRLPESTSYPSGHSMQAFLVASILADLLPERREALMSRAHRAAWSRIIGGVHFPTDDIAGRLLAQAILEELRRSPGFLKDLEDCRRELDQARASRSKP